MNPKNKAIMKYTSIFLFLLLIHTFLFASKKPNVVFIMCDDLNDYITGIEGQAGHPQSITPNVNKLAQSGVAFEKAYSNHPVCAPSRSSCFTGTYGMSSGNLFWGKWFTNEKLKNSKTMMEHFRDHGYYVAGSGKLLHHNKKDVWSEFKHEADYGPHAFNGEKKVAHPDVPKPFWDIGPTDGSFGSLESSSYLNDNNPKTGWVTGPWNNPKLMKFKNDLDRDRTPDEKNAEWAANRIRKFAESGDEKPFFLGVGFIRPHTPMHVSQKYFDRHPLDQVQLPILKKDDHLDTFYHKYFRPTQKGLRYYSTLKKSYTDFEEGLRKYTQAYLACVTAVDECIGQVVDAIDNSPFKDNTIIVITSDHGWNMGQKEFIFKNSPWEESCRIPLIIRAPGVAQAGGVAKHPVSLVDLYPTLTDLCGLDNNTKKNDQGIPLDGHSMRPFLVNPDQNEWTGPQGALSMIFIGDSFRKDLSREERFQLKNQHWSYRTERWRYIQYSGGDEELYDHLEDPYEWENLALNPEFKAVKINLLNEMNSIRSLSEL